MARNYRGAKNMAYILGFIEGLSAMLKENLSVQTVGPPLQRRFCLCTVKAAAMVGHPKSKLEPNDDARRSEGVHVRYVTPPPYTLPSLYTCRYTKAALPIPDDALWKV